jgi:hypothetical protein
MVPFKDSFVGPFKDSLVDPFEDSLVDPFFIMEELKGDTFLSLAIVARVEYVVFILVNT